MAHQAKPSGPLTVATLRDWVFVILGAGVILYGIGYLLSLMGRVLLIVILSVIFYITLSPFVDRLALRWHRSWAVLVVVFTAVVVVVGGGGLIGTILTGQIVSLVRKVPSIVQSLSVAAPGALGWLNHNDVHLNILDMENRILSNLGKLSSFVVAQALNIVTNIIGAVVDGAIVLFVTVYLLLDAERMQTALLRLVPVQRRDMVLAIEHTLTRVIGGYVRGQLLLSAIIGAAFGVGTWIIGLPYPLVIGVVAAVMELIPLLGPILGAILPFILTFFGHPLVQIPELAILIACVHLLESQVLGPRIIRTQVGLHPVLSVLALMLGAEWQGIWGALFAVPAAGVLVAAWVAAVRLWREKVILPASQPHVEERPGRVEGD
jgi:predicted PurR-regulated permease PerM